MEYHTTQDPSAPGADLDGTSLVHAAALRALSAAPAYAAWSAARRRELLYTAAERIDGARAELVEIALGETGLSRDRLGGEVTRTVNQLRLLGDHVAAGGHLSSRRSDGAAPGGGDIRTIDVPLGPVAVFAASNFPFAFGVPGGDTASALAAGCPVVVKGHPAQPLLSRRLAALLSEAADAVGAPEGTFGFVESADNAVSIALVQHPAIQAVGFTGSLGGGRALMDAAARRRDPIPVYAEMSSINPVFVLPGAAADPKWAAILAGSVLGSAGQLCTKPGLIVVPDSEDGRRLADETAAAVVESGPLTMLTEGMAAAHAAWRSHAVESQGVDVVSVSDPRADVRTANPFVVQIEAKNLTGELIEEHFGPTTVLTVADPGLYGTLMGKLGGQLTATILAAESDHAAAAELLPALASGAGRIVWNNVPTGVAVCEAMQHGGPWPATSASWSTSVGTEAVRRFVRPVALQGVPEELIA